MLYGRSGILSEGRRVGAPSGGADQVDGGLGFLRRQFASLAARKGGVNANDLSRVFANPGLRRFFSSQSPKKKKSLSSNLVSCLICFVEDSY